MATKKRLSVRYFDVIQDLVRYAVPGTSDGLYLVYDEDEYGQQFIVSVSNGKHRQHYFTLAEVKELLSSVEQ